MNVQRAINFPFFAIVMLLLSFNCGAQSLKSGNIMFETHLVDGRDVRVEVETTIAKPNRPPPPVEQLPPGAIVVVSDVEFTDCRVIISDNGGSEKTVWKKRGMSEPYIKNKGDVYAALEIMDVAEKDGFLAILYSAGKTEIDIIDLNAGNGHNINTHETLFRNSSLGFVKHGKIVWRDTISVILERDNGETETYCIDMVGNTQQ